MSDKRNAVSPHEPITKCVEHNLLVFSQKYQRKSTSNIDDKIKTERTVHSPSNMFNDFERFINEVEGRFTELQKSNRKSIRTPAKSTPKNNNIYKANIKKESIFNDSNDFVKITDEHIKEPWKSEDFISKKVDNSFEEIQFSRKQFQTKRLPKNKCTKNLKETQYLNEIRSTEFEKKLEKILFQTTHDNSEQSSAISETEVSENKTANDLGVSQDFIKTEIRSSAQQKHNNDIKKEESIKIENRNDLDLFNDFTKSETENIIAGSYIEDRKENISEYADINKHKKEIIIKDEPKRTYLKEKKLEDFSVVEIIVIDESQDEECLNSDEIKEEKVLALEKSPKDDIVIIKDGNNLNNTVIKNELQKEKKKKLDWSVISTTSEDSVIEDIKNIFETTNNFTDKSLAEKYHDISIKLLEKKFGDQTLNNTTLEESIIDDIRSIFETTNNLEKSIAEKYETSMKLLEEKFGDQINQIENSDCLSSAVSTSFEESVMDDIKNIFGFHNSENSLAEKYYDTNMKLLEENFGEQINLNKTHNCIASPSTKIICCNRKYIKHINSEGRKFFNNEQFVNEKEMLNEKCNLNETPKKNDKIYNKITFEEHSVNSSKKMLNNGNNVCYTAKSLLIITDENDLENLQEIIICVTYVVNLFFYNRF